MFNPPTQYRHAYPFSLTTNALLPALLPPSSIYCLLLTCLLAQHSMTVQPLSTEQTLNTRVYC